MLEGLLRTLAVVAGAIVMLSFALFAIDETRNASENSRAAIAGLEATRSSDPSPSEERARERAHSRVRETIDDADDVLVAPFAGLVDSSHSSWVRRGVPTLLALVIYGFGLSFLARYARGRA
ncbi:MAG TPA: hypothetical protein VLK59_01815 [Solirubrobacteraceae bacterium]|nr:hypothetical protein [Solirubrobacteraceae bacterium]